MTKTGSWAVTATLLAVAAAPAMAQDHGLVEVPLSAPNGRMVVPVQAPDGTDLTFLIGTGTAMTVLSESAAAQLGDQEVTLGGVALNMENREVIPDARLVVNGVQADGMVGNNTLNSYDILFDVPEGRLVLKPFGPAVDWPGMQLSDPIRLRVYHGVVIGLDVEVSGTEYPAMLELGASALLVNAAVLHENGISGSTVDYFRLGSSSFENVPIELSDNPIIERFSPTGEGFVVVGAPIVLDCAVSISFIHREMRTCVR